MNIFNNLCRSCNTKKEKLLNIHDSEESTKLIRDMLEYCLHTSIKNEPKYPKFVCYDCLKELEISYGFIKRFHLSQGEFEQNYIHLQKCIGNANDIDKDTVEININETRIVPHSLYYGMPLNMVLSIKDHIKNKPAIRKFINVSKVLEKTPARKCSLCNKAFFTKKALILHLKLNHKQKV